MAKKKSNKEEMLNAKEEKAMNTWLPIGLMIGTVIGAFASFEFDNLLYLGGGCTGGLLLGTMLGSIFAEDNVKVELKKKIKK